LNEPADRNRFRRFLQGEYSSENLEFYLESERLVNTVREDSIRKAYAVLLRKHIRQTAKAPINISSSLQERLLELGDTAVGDAYPAEMVGLVAEAHKEISFILEHGSFQRFRLGRQED
jgi:hypothetical protein